MRNGVLFWLPHNFPVVGPVGRKMAQLLNSDRNSYKGGRQKSYGEGAGEVQKNIHVRER